MRDALMQIPCVFCGEGKMVYNRGLSFEDYSLPDSFVLEDIDSIVDGIINEYLVYECYMCGSIEKLTYKEIEKIERRNISQMVMNSAAKGEIMAALLSRKPKVLIYCGKCGGIDGKGTCLLKTYSDCKLKRLPNEL